MVGNCFYFVSFQYKLEKKEKPIEEKMKLIRQAIEAKKKLKMTYLKTNDERSERYILPEYLGELTYQGKSFLWVEGYCFQRKDKRVFRVDRILDLELAERTDD